MPVKVPRPADRQDLRRFDWVRVEEVAVWRLHRDKVLVKAGETLAYVAFDELRLDSPLGRASGEGEVDALVVRRYWADGVKVPYTVVEEELPF
jgi:hypothetical protein